MALTLGTNAGFVTVAPTADPSDGLSNFDTEAKALKDTSPATAIKITEIGWYAWNATQEANYEVGIYNVGDNNHEAVVGSLSQTNAKGTNKGWKVVTGLDITISPSTIYWLAVQLDDTATASRISKTDGGADKVDRKTSQTTLVDPWGVSTSSNSDLVGIYALWEAAGTNMQINIGDAWKTVDGMQINIGDVWKNVDGAQINIGDSWKTIF